jgi:sodium/proline symporter
MNLFQITSYSEVLLPLFGWGLGYLGMPHIITKFMAIDKTKNLRKSMYVGISWQILSLLASLGTGLVSIAFFQHGIENAELVFVELAQTLVNPLIAAAALCGILAATISTMDSQILVASTFAAEDLLHKLKWTKNIGRETLFRIAVILISSAAFIIALSRNATIMDTVYYAWAGLGASFAPLVLAALFLKRIPASYAIAGLLVGGLLSAIWPTCNAYLFNLDLLPVIPSLIPGFGINMMILMVGSFSKKSI